MNIYGLWTSKLWHLSFYWMLYLQQDWQGDLVLTWMSFPVIWFITPGHYQEIELIKLWWISFPVIRFGSWVMTRKTEILAKPMRNLHLMHFSNPSRICKFSKRGNNSYPCRKKPNPFHKPLQIFLTIYFSTNYLLFQISFKLNFSTGL